MTSEQPGDGHDNGFHSLKTQSREFLNEIKGRSLCPKCGKCRKFFCYTCYVLMEDVKMKLRQVKLPIKVDIIKHPNEVDGKSTAPHARVISPDDVTIYTYPCIPEYDREKVILVFPSQESVTLDQLKATELQDSWKSNTDGRMEQVRQSTNEAGSDERMCTGVHHCGTKELDSDHMCCTDRSDSDRKRKAVSASEDSTPCDSESKRTKLHEKDGRPEAAGEFDISGLSDWKCLPSFDRVVFIDSTWLQSKKIFSDERLKGIRQVEIKTRLTKYWRPQGNHPDTYLATIEAIYYFFVDFHKVFVSDHYTGDYDNLLFFFLYTYDKVKLSKNSKKACKR